AEAGVQERRYGDRRQRARRQRRRVGARGDGERAREVARPRAARAHRRSGDERPRAEVRPDDAGRGRASRRGESRLGSERGRPLRAERSIRRAGRSRPQRAPDRPDEGERQRRSRRARPRHRLERRAGADDAALRAEAQKPEARHRDALPRGRQRRRARGRTRLRTDATTKTRKHENTHEKDPKGSFSWIFESSCFRGRVRQMIKTVGVIGAGTMGNGIAQVFAQAGFTVRLVDVAQPMLDRARTTIDKSLAKFVEKGKLAAADKDATLGRLSTTTSLDLLSDADYIVEAIVENADAKGALFTSLD